MLHNLKKASLPKDSCADDRVAAAEMKIPL